eukprot:5349964-Pleurochrysis_carterae.AAC.1
MRAIARATRPCAFTENGDQLSARPCRGSLEDQRRELKFTSLRKHISILFCEFNPRAWCSCNVFVATGKFGRYEHVLSKFCGVSVKSASGVAQQMGGETLIDDCDEATRYKGKVDGISEHRKVGYFHQLPTAKRERAVLAVMQVRADASVEARFNCF